MTTVSCFLDGFKSLFVRLLLTIHGGLAVHFVISAYDTSDWWYLLTLPLFVLTLDGLINIFFLMNAKCFWSVCGVLYLIAVVPVFWIVEVENMKMQHAVAANNTKVTLDLKTVHVKGFSIIESVFGSDLAVYKRWADVGVFVVIIAGRWLTAIGQLSRDDIKSLLLVLVAQAPDTMVLRKPLAIKAETLEEDWVKTIAVMIVFTVSLIEFTLKSPTSLKNKIDAQKKKRKNSDAQDCDEESDKAGTSGKGMPQVREIIVNPVAKDSFENSTKSDNEKSDGDEHETKVYPTEPIEMPDTVHELTDGLDDLKKLGLDKLQDNVYVKKGVDLTKRTLGSRRFAGCTNIIEFMFRTALTLCLHSGPAFVLRLTMAIRYTIQEDIQLFFLVKNGVEIVVLLHQCFKAFKIKRTVGVDPEETSTKETVKKGSGTLHDVSGHVANSRHVDVDDIGNVIKKKRDSLGFNFNVEC